MYYVSLNDENRLKPLLNRTSLVFELLRCQSFQDFFHAISYLQSDIKIPTLCNKGGVAFVVPHWVRASIIPIRASRKLVCEYHARKRDKEFPISEMGPCAHARPSTIGVVRLRSPLIFAGLPFSTTQEGATYRLVLKVPIRIECVGVRES